MTPLLSLLAAVVLVSALIAVVNLRSYLRKRHCPCWVPDAEWAYALPVLLECRANLDRVKARGEP
jgi:hypothetical protein